MDYVTETYTPFDWSSLKVVRKGRNNSDTGVSAIKDDKWVVKRRILPPVVKGKNNPGPPATWIDRYFLNIRYRLAHDGSLKIPMYPRSEIKEPSIDLQSSLKMFFQEGAFDADEWADVNRSYCDRRSFPAFLDLIERSGLGDYAFNEDTFLQDGDMNIRYPQDRYLLSHKVSPDVVVANKYYDGSLSLMRLLRRIRSESADHFRQEQAQLLDSFLDNLIKIQQEQRFIAKSFSEHLEQLRKSGEVAFSSNPVNDDDGDRPKCPIISSDNAMDSYTRQQKISFYPAENQHLLDSLCIMSRESVWLLKKLKDSPFTSPSSILEFNKILDILMVFIPKFKKSKELMDRCPPMLYYHSISYPFQLIVGNNEILHSFRGCIKDLQEQGVERNSLAETLLGCFVDVVNMYYNLADLGDPSRDTCSSLQYSFPEAAKQTSELINEAVDKLNSVRFSDLTGGGSPLGCIALWRILFESSLINPRLDLICKKHSETVEHGVKLFGTATNDQLDQIRLSIDELLTAGESVLVEFIAMHKSVAEVSYMLGDAFTTGGAGTRGLSDVTHPCKHNDQLMDFNPEDFPWDKHNVPRTTIGPNSEDWPRCYEDYE